MTTMGTDPQHLAERVEHDFTLHPPANAEVAGNMDAFRAKYKELALLVADCLPPSCREQSMALTKLEEACFFTIAALARHNNG